MTILLMLLWDLLSWRWSYFSKGWSDQANILDLVLTICDLYFKIVKSKIKNFPSAIYPFSAWFSGGPSLKMVPKSRTIFKFRMTPFFLQSLKWPLHFNENEFQKTVPKFLDKRFFMPPCIWKMFRVKSPIFMSQLSITP